MILLSFIVGTKKKRENTSFREVKAHLAFFAL